MYLDTPILVVVSFVELLEASVYGTFNMAPADVVRLPDKSLACASCYSVTPWS